MYLEVDKASLWLNKVFFLKLQLHSENLTVLHRQRAWESREISQVAIISNIGDIAEKWYALIFEVK